MAKTCDVVKAAMLRVLMAEKSSVSKAATCAVAKATICWVVRARA